MPMKFLNIVRSKVSADKNRYSEGTYDLDLTYITDRIIAMAFPAEGMESAFRNSIDEVADFLESSHTGHYMVYNLCSEKSYETSKFNDNVRTWCGFPDHHAPPLALLFKIIQDIYKFLSEDEDNVVVVHCLAGKGRTGVVISCFLLYCGLFDSYEKSLAYFASKRSTNNWGVTGPSQRRCVEYFGSMIIDGARPNIEPVFLESITLSHIPKVTIF